MELSSIISQLNWRLATKNFDPSKKISNVDFGMLLEALRLTASSYGLQPWKFVVVKNAEVREKLKAASYGQPQITDSSHLIVLCAKTSLSETDVNEYLQRTAEVRGLSMENLEGFKGMLSSFVGGKSSEMLQAWATKQTYIALGNLLTSCAMVEIDSCPMEGYDQSAYNQILGLDKLGLTAAVVCPVGYRKDGAPETKEKKVRFNIEDLVIEV